MELNPQELVATLENKITLYKHLGIQVLHLDGNLVHFKVSLEKSLNHKGTAFGGSLYTDAVLAAYALVFAALRHHHITTENIVIAKGSIEYRRPVDSDFEVKCQFTSSEQEVEFFKSLKEQGRARTRIESQILGAGGSLKASFSGDFVVKL